MTLLEPRTPLPWEAGEVLVHDLFLRGNRLVKCWTIVGEPGGAPHEFYWEIYRGALGAGETVAAAAVWHIGADNRPTAYEIWSDRLPVRRVRFVGSSAFVELTDGSEQLLTGPGPATAVLQANVIGQLALFAATLPTSEAEVATVFFSPEALTLQPLTATRIRSGPDGTTWSTSLGADLVCDCRGRLVRMQVPSQRLEALPAQDNFFPAIDREALRRPKLQYTAPQTLAIDVSDVTFDSPGGSVGAALSQPRARGGAAGTLPGVLFLQGSGRHDRHGMAPGLDTGVHQLVDRLSERGFAALRYDSRGAGTTPFGSILDAGLDNFVDTAEAALAWLERHPAVRPGCAVIGHSLGALVALRLAERVGPERVRAAALLAPPGRTLDQLLLDQADRESRRLQLPQEESRPRHDALSALLTRVASEETTEAQDALILGMPRRLLRELITTDPTDLLARALVPVLICQGEKDIQVNPRVDTKRLTETAERLSLPDVEFRLFPDLDHLFMVEPGTSSPARYFIPRPIGDDLIASLDEWLHRQLV